MKMHRILLLLAILLHGAPLNAGQGGRVLPPDVNVAYVDVQRIALESAAGKAARAKLQAFTETRAAEIAEKEKGLVALQQGLEQLPDTERPQRQKEIERLQVDIARMREDADRELRMLDGQLFGEVQKKLTPILLELIKERGIMVLLRADPASMVVADLRLDLTPAVIERLDALEAAAPPAPAPAAPAPK